MPAADSVVTRNHFSKIRMIVSLFSHAWTELSIYKNKPSVMTALEGDHHGPTSKLSTLAQTCPYTGYIDKTRGMRQACPIGQRSFS